MKYVFYFASFILTYIFFLSIKHKPFVNKVNVECKHFIFFLLIYRGKINCHWKCCDSALSRIAPSLSK